MEIKEFKEILTELGFHRTKILGVWRLNNNLYLGNNIEVCVFVYGNFWVSENSRRIYSGNFKEIPVSDFIENLVKILDKL